MILMKIAVEGMNASDTIEQKAKGVIAGTCAADQAVLSTIGGEPLEGSGFENEEPDEGFINPTQSQDPE